MSISLTSTEGFNILPAAEELARFFPQLDDDLNSVTVYTPMNTDTLDVDIDSVFLSSGSGRGDKSTCLTPVSIGMDLSMIANKGSMTLSVDGFDDDDETTLSAATTPSLPTDDIKLETCYCCPTHAEQGQPPDCEFDNDMLFRLPEPLKIPDTKIISSSPEKQSMLPTLKLQDEATTSFGLNARKLTVRKVSDPVSPRMQKQISLFESGEFERQKEFSAIHASINIPASTQQLKQDERLRKFENLTQSTSNSNFPFESNTLKRVTHNPVDFVDVTHTQSCLNLKTSMGVSSTPSATASPQRKFNFKNAAQSCSTVATETIPEPSAGALIVKEKFIEPPKRIARSFHGKTQSMDADFLFNEFLLVPARTTVPITHSSSSGTSSPSTSPSSRPNSRFIATKVVDDMAILGTK